MKSRTEGRRLLSMGAVQVNNRIEKENRPIAESDLLHGRYILVQIGKKHFELYKTST